MSSLKFAFLRKLCYNIYRKWVNFMKLWVDDLRQPPSDEWLWAMSVDQAKLAIKVYEINMYDDTIIIDLILIIIIIYTHIWDLKGTLRR